MTLHVVNGRSTEETLLTTTIEGEIISWNDVLHVGPLIFDPEESRPIRASFLAQQGWEDAEAIVRELELRDARLAAARHVVIWVEHDLYDQLQLLQILSQTPGAADVELIQSDVYLGTLLAEELEAWWPQRTPVSRQTRMRASEAWRSVTGGNLDVDVPELPYLATALRRFAQERETLPRTKRQLLQLLVEAPRTPLELFDRNRQLEEAEFLGDDWLFRFLEELERDGLIRGPLPARPPFGDHRTFVTTRIEVTGEGRRLL
jgi:Domain of unknown function (DUF1835)